MEKLVESIQIEWNKKKKVVSPSEKQTNRKISMIFPLVSCCSCVNNPSSS